MKGLKFEPIEEEIPIQYNGGTYPFTVRGFTADEFEDIASHAVTYDRDPETNKPIGRVNYGILRRIAIFEGVIQAPPEIEEWTLEAVKALPGVIRNQLFVAIKARSDEIEDFQKKSGPP